MTSANMPEDLYLFLLMKVNISREVCGIGRAPGDRWRQGARAGCELRGEPA